MNRKTNIYVLAGLMAIVILALPQASAADGDDNEQTVKAAEETSKGYMAIGAGLAIGLWYKIKIGHYVGTLILQLTK